MTGYSKYRNSSLFKGLTFLVLSVWCLSILPSEWLHDAIYIHHDTIHNAASDSGGKIGLGFETGHQHCSDPFLDLHKKEFKHFQLFEAVGLVFVILLAFYFELNFKEAFVANPLNKGPPID